jgi:peptide/nickel transport system ATP-binding protein
LVQPVFQDPYSSLNPRKTIGEILELPLWVHGIGTSAERSRAVAEVMAQVGLADRLRAALPNQLSGGQRQRVAIARALVVRPQIVICDEPTSALDVSVQAQILNLLLDLRKTFGLTLVFISHNLAVVEHLSTRVAVMYLVRIVEQADVDTLFESPRHAYTQTLLASVLTPDPHAGLPQVAASDIMPSPMAPPTGCTFHPRCPHAEAACSTERPDLRQVGRTLVACHLAK